MSLPRRKKISSVRKIWLSKRMSFPDGRPCGGVYFSGWFYLPIPYKWFVLAKVLHDFLDFNRIIIIYFNRRKEVSKLENKFFHDKKNNYLQFNYFFFHCWSETTWKQSANIPAGSFTCCMMEHYSAPFS